MRTGSSQPSLQGVTPTFLSSPYLTSYPQHCPDPVSNCVQPITAVSYCVQASCEEQGHQLILSSNIFGGVQNMHLKTQ